MNVIADLEASQMYFEGALNSWLDKQSMATHSPVNHGDPALYGFTQKEADDMRDRYLKQILKENKDRLKYCQQLRIELIERYPKVVEKDQWFVAYLTEENDKEIQRLEKVVLHRKKYLEDRTIEEIRNYPIQDIIKLYNLKTEKVGPKREKMNCPFHNEKTPSLVVYIDHNSFYCFGCGKGGGVIDFVRFYEDITVPKAIKIIANLLT